MREKDYRKIIQDDVNSLFFHWELEKCEISKSVKPDREWDYVLKLKMGKKKVREDERERL